MYNERTRSRCNFLKSKFRFKFFLHAFSSSCTEYCSFEQFECRKDCCCFTDCFSSCTAMCWVNPHGFPGTAGTPVPMTDSLTTRTSRIQNHAPHIGVHTAVYPPVGNFWCATIHCSSEPRSCSMQIRDCQEQRRTLRARRHALRIHELIRLHVRLPESYGILPESMDTLRSAAHSVIAIFRHSQRLYRRNPMENPG